MRRIPKSMGTNRVSGRPRHLVLIISDTRELVDEAHNFADLPELPDDDEFWDEDLDGEGEADLDSLDHDGEHDGEQDGSPSNDSSVTLSSKSSKRGYSELDNGNDDEEFELGLTHSPGMWVNLRISRS